MPVSAAIGAAIASLLGLFVVSCRPGAFSGPKAPEPVARTQSIIKMRHDRVVKVSADITRAAVGVDLVGVDWPYLYDFFSSRFPDIPVEPPHKTMTVEARDGSGTYLRFERRDDTLNIVLDAPSPGAAEQHSNALMSLEQGRLWALMDTCPHPAWMTDGDRSVVWANPAFEDLCQSLGLKDARTCPFEIRSLTEEDPKLATRISIKDATGKRQWFEVTSARTTHGAAHVATSIEALINAENAQRNFVQTLSKTFAHLTTGLAVFDKDHRLVLFNPALLDLTGVSVEFLSARPGVTAFFDQLRESRILPEPKNYTAWRDSLTEVVAAARDDRYSETWNLPSGLTYSVVGRPHPDGALAFLIEDISAEISLTRRFRSELELSQSVMNCIKDAIAVFSRTGVLTFCNEAYKTLWQHDPSTAFAETTIVDATAAWREGCKPSPVWTEIREFVLQETERTAWDALLELPDGNRLTCMIEPLAGGATLVRFHRVLVDLPETIAKHPQPV